MHDNVFCCVHKNLLKGVIEVRKRDILEENIKTTPPTRNLDVFFSKCVQTGQNQLTRMGIQIWFGRFLMHYLSLARLTLALCILNPTVFFFTWGWPNSFSLLLRSSSFVFSCVTSCWLHTNDHAYISSHHCAAFRVYCFFLFVFFLSRLATNRSFYVMFVVASVLFLSFFTPPKSCQVHQIMHLSLPFSAFGTHLC